MYGWLFELDTDSSESTEVSRISDSHERIIVLFILKLKEISPIKEVQQ